MKRGPIVTTVMLLSAICLFLALNACTKDKADTLPEEAQKRLQAHISACGPGVVEGRGGPNRCLYRIRVDEIFRLPLHERLGAVAPVEYWKNLPYFTPTKEEIENIKSVNEWDWHTKHAGICGTRSQGSCGSCWFFSTAHQWKNHFKLLHPDTACLDIAYQWGVDCEPDDFSGCGGGWHSTGKMKLGAVYTPDYSPYYASNRRCLTSKVNPDPITAFDNIAYVGSKNLYYDDITDEEIATRARATVGELMVALKNYGPLSITERGFDAGKGIYNRCSTSSGINHMTVLTGFVWLNSKGEKVEAGKGDLYFYRQNSWRTESAAESRRTVKATPYSGFAALNTTRTCQNMGQTAWVIMEEVPEQ